MILIYRTTIEKKYLYLIAEVEFINEKSFVWQSLVGVFVFIFAVVVCN